MSRMRVQRIWGPGPLRVVIVLVAASLLAIGPAAWAGTGFFTKGDANAVLHTYPTSKNLFERLIPPGAIGPYERRSLDIRPFPAYDELPYCAEDWHVLALAYWDGEYTVEDPFIVHTRADVLASLGLTDARFFLDGTPIELARGPVKPVLERDLVASFEGPEGLDAEVGQLWGFQWGRLLAPQELQPGEHTFSAVVSTPEAVVFQGEAVFTVSPAGSPACTPGS